MTSIVKLEMMKFESRMIELMKSYDEMKENEENRELNVNFRKKLFELSDYVGNLIIESEKFKHGDLLMRVQQLERKSGKKNIYDVN